MYGSVDGFVKDVDDMLINPAYLGALGEGGASWANGPSLRNWGMEFALGYRKNLACGLGLEVTANLTSSVIRSLTFRKRQQGLMLIRQLKIWLNPVGLMVPS